MAYELTDDEFAEAATAAMPCPEGFYWRRADASEHARHVKDGLHAMALSYTADDDSHFVYMVTERQGARR
ncbi:hypothetical protein [Williamsia sp.]|uniref:hypothetical protein n=1 Tax=Williamsia sp. TaxID=1872085 RepID=UPI002F955AC5